MELKGFNLAQPGVAIPSIRTPSRSLFFRQYLRSYFWNHRKFMEFIWSKSFQAAMSECLLYERNLCWLHHILLVACSWIHVSWNSKSHLQLNHEIWVLSELLRLPFFKEKLFFFFSIKGSFRSKQFQEEQAHLSAYLRKPKPILSWSLPYHLVLREYSEVFSKQMGDVIPPACCRSPLSFFSQAMLKLLYLVLLHAEEHQLCFWLCPNIPPPEKQISAPFI